MFPKYSDTQKICCNHPISWKRWFFLKKMHPKDAEGIANSVDPDQIAPLFSQICPKIYGNFGSAQTHHHWIAAQLLTAEFSHKFLSPLPPGPLGQSNWHSGGGGFDPRSGHISCVEIWSWNSLYCPSFTTADWRRAIISYWRKYRDLVLVNRLGSFPRNRVDRLTDQLDMTLIVSTMP